MSSPAWPKLRDHFVVEVEALKEAGIVIGTSEDTITPAQKRALTLCGLPIPTTVEEQMRTYLAFRAVATYVTTKLQELEFNRGEYLRGVQQLREEEGLPASEPQSTLKSS